MAASEQNSADVATTNTTTESKEATTDDIDAVKAAKETSDNLPDPPLSPPMHTLSKALQTKDPEFNESHLLSVPPNYEIPNTINTSKKLCIVYNFINNEYCVPHSKEYFDNVNPATNQVISKVASSDSTDINNAVLAAKEAYPKWRALTRQERSKYLLAIADSIKKNMKEFAILESRDNGKPVLLASMVDIPRAESNFRFFAGQIIHDHTHCHQMNDAINYSHRSPLGVCALITPWNLPIYLLSWKIAPAIACGNTVVCKPSELTPMTAYLLTKSILESGLPKGVVNIVQGYGKNCGEPLCKHDDIAGISFTGGTTTGSRISLVAAPLFKRISLECGGKNATIVFNDCNNDINTFEKTVDGVCRASFANQGQICLCGERLFIQKGIYKKFLNALIEKTISNYSSKIGNPLTSGYGSLISLEHRKKIEYYVSLAKKNGGKIVLGGKRPDNLGPPFNEGAFYLPTIITNLSHKDRCSKEEIFGPIVTVHEFETVDEVVDMCNQVKYGLAGSVWTNDIKTGHNVAQRIETGMIWVNCWLYRDLRVPFGGVKYSGIGREGGLHSMDFWTHQKNVCRYVDM